MPFSKQRAALAPGERRAPTGSPCHSNCGNIANHRRRTHCRRWAGKARRALFDAGAGMTRLVTRRVSRSSAEQRHGRAGRTEPGVCYRLWTKGEEGGLIPADPPEIIEADLGSLMLDLAVWGIGNPASLRWLDPPPAQAVSQARELLLDLGALDTDGRPTGPWQIVGREAFAPEAGSSVDPWTSIGGK